MANSARILVRTIVGKAMASHGRILRGAGRGLRFDPTGGSLHYILGPIIRYEEEALVRFLKNGSIFYDIGSNIGFYAIVGARLVGTTGKVFAFELFPESAEAIRRNARLNRQTNVTVDGRAVDQESGWMNLALTEIPEMHRLDVGSGRKHLPERHQVQTVSIDDFVFVEHAPPPSVGLIDVEGAEFRVLEGMRRTMKEYRPLVICENHWLVDEMQEFCRTDLPRLGYTVSRLGGGEIPDRPTWYHFILMPNEYQDSL